MHHFSYILAGAKHCGWEEIWQISSNSKVSGTTSPTSMMQSEFEVKTPAAHEILGNNFVLWFVPVLFIASDLCQDDDLDEDHQTKCGGLLTNSLPKYFRCC